MKYLLMLIGVLGFHQLSFAVDVVAGKSKVDSVCSACHGSNGVSVSDTIPNLAGQRSGYIENQLKALKEGTRKNDIMNAIASQLSLDDIKNTAAFFASQPGAIVGSKSDFLPNLVKTNANFPENYQSTFKKYLTLNFPATQQVRYYFANPKAIEYLNANNSVGNGALVLVEVFSAKLDATNKPVMGKDGFYEPNKLLFYTSMESGPDWGKNIPEMLRNADWNYAVFTTDKKLRAGVNQAECLACHKPLESTSYLFTSKSLIAAK